MVTYQIEVSWLQPKMAGLVIGALFILPFVLFSATSGQLTDKYEKTRIIRWVKWLEIAIMLLAGVGFWRADIVVLERNPLKVDPDTIAAIKVLETYVGGARKFAA